MTTVVRIEQSMPVRFRAFLGSRIQNWSPARVDLRARGGLFWSRPYRAHRSQLEMGIHRDACPPGTLNPALAFPDSMTSLTH